MIIGLYFGLTIKRYILEEGEVYKYMDKNIESFIINKYKDRLISEILNDCKEKARIGVQRILDTTKERHYKINGLEVKEDEFFKELTSTDGNYFNSGLWMTVGLDRYSQTYKDTLSAKTAYDVYKSFLSFDDKVIQDQISLKELFPTGLRYTSSEEYEALNN